MGLSFLDGKILACAGNRVERNHDPTAHAEILVIREAAALHYLKQAFEILKRHFPDNSPHELRLKEKIKFLNSKLV